MNLYVIRSKQATGAVTRGIFDLSEFDMSTLMPAPPADELKQTSSAVPDREATEEAAAAYSPPAAGDVIEMEDMRLNVIMGVMATSATLPQ